MVETIGKVSWIQQGHMIFKVKVTALRSRAIGPNKCTSTHLPFMENVGHSVKVKGHRAKTIMPVDTNPSWRMYTCNLQMAAPIVWVQQVEHDFQGQDHSFKVKDHRAKEMC